MNVIVVVVNNNTTLTTVVTVKHSMCLSFGLSFIVLVTKTVFPEF